ncbi:hypothetical protein D5066_21600 [Enterobacter chuandaensis]|nr:hypothetical protein D5066_21600 [Enterobacter chuandaensis]
MHVTCQIYTQNFYVAQHFKIKGNYSIKQRLKPDNVLPEAVICCLEETLKSNKTESYFFSDDYMSLNRDNEK